MSGSSLALRKKERNIDYLLEVTWKLSEALYSNCSGSDDTTTEDYVEYFDPKSIPEIIKFSNVDGSIINGETYNNLSGHSKKIWTTDYDWSTRSEKTKERTKNLTIEEYLIELLKPTSRLSIRISSAKIIPNLPKMLMDNTKDKKITELETRIAKLEAELKKEDPYSTDSTDAEPYPEGYDAPPPS
jgi:hypothetical protein